MLNLNFPPMLAERSSPASGRAGVNFRTLMETGDWVADTKIDGVRILARWDDTTKLVVLWNRSQVDVTFKYPDIVQQLTPVLMGKTKFVLDGEVVAKDGRFESTLMRDQQQNPTSAAQMAVQYPAIFLCFDWIPCLSGTVIKAVTFTERRAMLETLAGRNPDELKLTPISLDPDFLDITRTMGMEGAVIKRASSPYLAGRTKQWIKFRNLYRVTCMVTCYTAGTGARKDFGAMELSLLGPDGPVSVGRCGTGFKTAEIPGLKAKIDAAAGSPVLVEIEATNKTKNGTLRFPVYKGIRTDVAPTDCTLDQLDTLPTC